MKALIGLTILAGCYRTPQTLPSQISNTTSVSIQTEPHNATKIYNYLSSQNEEADLPYSSFELSQVRGKLLDFSSIDILVKADVDYDGQPQLQYILEMHASGTNDSYDSLVVLKDTAPFGSLDRIIFVASPPKPFPQVDLEVADRVYQQIVNNAYLRIVEEKDEEDNSALVHLLNSTFLF